MRKSSPTRHIAVQAVRKAAALLKNVLNLQFLLLFRPSNMKQKSFFGARIFKNVQKSLHCIDYSTVEGPIMQNLTWNHHLNIRKLIIFLFAFAVLSS